MEKIETDENTFQTWLQSEYSRRTRQNPSYSVRAFAQFLKMDSSTVSQILKGKRRVSEKVIKRIEDRLESRFPRPFSGAAGEYSLIMNDMFNVISDWYHFAILDLTLIKDFQSDPKWIGRKLEISVSEARLAIDRLLRLGYLVKVDGRLKKSKKRFTNYHEGTTSGAHKEYQRQIVRKALLAIDETPQEEKDITGMTIAGKLKDVPKAKELIKNFRRDFCSTLERGATDTVFHLCVQFYPVSNQED